MDQNKFYKLIELAQKKSKEDFLRFATSVYGVDESVFNHIFEIPIIGRYDADEVVTTGLSTKTEDELYEIIDNTINGYDVWKDDDGGKYINFDEITSLSKSEINELYNLIDYNAVIVYNDLLFRERIDKDSKRLSEEDLVNKYLMIIKETLTHERVHVNNAYLDIFLNHMTRADIENEMASLGKDEEEAEYIIHSDTINFRENVVSLNGAEVNSLKMKDDNQEYIEFWNDNNEVMVETICQMMSNYKSGENLEECLKRVIEKRNGKTIYPGIDDKVVLSIYALFTEELTKWMMFGAYNLKRKNKLQEFFIEVYGTDMQLEPNEFIKKIEEYISKLKEDLTSTQREILQMLGISVDKKIGIESFKNVATSPNALEALDGSLQDLKEVISIEDNVK